MAISAWEQAESRTINDGENPTAETRWLITGTSDDNAALVYLYGILPTVYTFPSGKQAVLNSVSLDETGTDSWVARPKYSVYEVPKTDDVDYEFDISVQMERITQSLQTQAYAPSGKQAPNFGGAIGVDGDRIEGIDAPFPKFSFSVTKYWDAAAVTQAYQIQVAELAGRTNAAPFYGLPAGSVMFKGARGRQSGDKFPISYQFEFAKPESGISIDEITVPSKKGWEYLDVYYETQVDEDAKKKVRRARAVYVHTITNESNFALLGIGT
jgi:hypothetical protein